MMYKKEARRMYNKKRLAITPQEKIKWDDLLLIQFQKVELPFLSTLLSFYPLEEKNEINTFIITDFLLFQNPGLKIAYP
ncbi:MAG: 5-formyltetrahydrofolate cyclo-ligase, partial [Flavisolibacter sp.]|nr:5-formyltetrahydrofolate cyclo-ligase [Flavisolibacter sp.]